MPLFFFLYPPVCCSCRYNCREEFQIHDDLLKANYTVGRISEATLEHYLVQVSISATEFITQLISAWALGTSGVFLGARFEYHVEKGTFTLGCVEVPPYSNPLMSHLLSSDILQGKYFMVRDVYGKLDVLNTTGSCGAPNFRQAKGGYAVFGMGQPSLNGFKLVLQKLQREGHKVGGRVGNGMEKARRALRQPLPCYLQECVFFCVREEPVVFLRLEGDFVSYTPRGKENLHENLQRLQRGVRAESLELAIRKEVSWVGKGCTSLCWFRVGWRGCDGQGSPRVSRRSATLRS